MFPAPLSLPAPGSLSSSFSSSPLSASPQGCPGLSSHFLTFLLGELFPWLLTWTKCQDHPRNLMGKFSLPGPTQETLIPAGSGVVKPEIRKLLKFHLRFSCTPQVQFHHPESGGGSAGGWRPSECPFYPKPVALTVARVLKLLSHQWGSRLDPHSCC